MKSLAYLIAHCQHNLGSELSPLPEPLRYPNGLLAEALRLDPTDIGVRRKIADNLSQYLRYTIHEIPCGVLYSSASASADQCDELLEILHEFTTHVDLLGDRETFSDLIRDCEFHFNKYRDYLLGRAPEDSYAAFLDRDLGS